MQAENQGDVIGSLPLGIAFSIIMAAGFFAFIGLGTFAPTALTAPLTPTHRLSVGLALGLGLIAMSAITTLIYAVRTNSVVNKFSN